VSTAKTGGYLSCTVPVEQDEAIGARSRTMKHKLELSSVRAVVGNDKRGVEVLHEFWYASQPAPSNTVRLLSAVRGYQYVSKPAQLDQDAKDGMVAFMCPIIDGAFVPKQSKSNDEKGIEQRVEIPQRKIKDVVLDSFVKLCIDEWIELKKNRLREFLWPVSDEVLYEKQSRPTQRVILEKADYEPDKETLSTFGKREAYGRVNYQRNITTIPGKEKKLYSKYMYAYSDFIKTMPWYAFGKKPCKVADRVAELCRGARCNALITDYSFFDGSINAIFRLKQQMEVLSVFHPSVRPELLECLKKQRSRSARTRFGVTYHTGESRLSGSAETSVQNTDDNAFVSYVAFRRSRDSSGSYLTPEEAWSRLGVAGGDDGLVVDLDKQIMDSTANRLGLTLKCEEVKRGSVGVVFLSRHYGPDVWFGDPSSMCDIKRILSKFHVTVAMPSNITQQKKLFEKAYALSLTDSNTPVVGKLVTKVTALFEKSMTYDNSLDIWNGDVPKDVHYPNVNNSWMYECCKGMLPDFDHSKFNDWIDNATTEDILYPPVCCNRPPPNAKPGIVECDGDLTEIPQPTENTKQVGKVASKPPSRVRKSRSRPRKKKADRPSRQRSKPT